MGFDVQRAVVVAGDGVVARFPGVLCVARCPDPGPLRHLLELCEETSGDSPGRTLAKRLASWLAGPDAPDEELVFGTVAAAGEQLAVFLAGPVSVEVAGSGLALSGTDAASWTDRLLPLPDSPVVLALAGVAPRPEVAIDVLDLRGGAVPGAGVVLLNGPAGGEQAHPLAERGSRTVVKRPPPEKRKTGEQRVEAPRRRPEMVAPAPPVESWQNEPLEPSVPEGFSADEWFSKESGGPSAPDGSDTRTPPEALPRIDPLTDPGHGHGNGVNGLNGVHGLNGVNGTHGGSNGSGASNASNGVGHTLGAEAPPLANSGRHAVLAESLPKINGSAVPEQQSAEPVEQTPPEWAPAEQIPEQIPEPVGAPGLDAETELAEIPEASSVASPPRAPRRAEAILGVAPAEPVRAPLEDGNPVGARGAVAAPESPNGLDPNGLDSGAVRDDQQARGHLCARGHLNDPRSHFCVLCGIRMNERTGVLVVGQRPPLGLLVFDDGATYTVDAEYLVGRMPEADTRVRSGALRSIVVEDRSGAVSRVHAEIRINGWDVLITDSGSRNGTFIAGPSEPGWTPLPPGRPRRMVPGTRVRMGGRTFVFESPSGVR
ncbi:FHA domain-containing protein [Pseudonocardia sp. TRM90224]|uniref:FHA domain-containing protein n=1 Tax=Pseudonocardia sp. TRM90224 TaxID=2812678 RepID=UPI001E2FC5F9|nr:FHA domain-containing protein [Pseudonocardia sp. TRM90224]